MAGEQQVTSNLFIPLETSADTGLGRITRSIVQSSSSVETYLKTISEKAKKADEVARIIDADCTSFIVISLHG